MLTATLLAVLIGVSLGLLGGGGSILAVPLLVYVVGLGTRDAVATSLFVVGLASAAAMIPHARAGRVNVRVGLPFGIASMAGAFAGGRLAHLLPEALLLGGFTAVMVVTAFAMMRPRRDGADGEREASGDVASTRSAMARASVVGVAIGMLTGIVGAGGGFVIVPALVLLCGLPIRAAVGTSLMVIAMNSFAAFAGAMGHASVPWRTGAAIAGAAMVGSMIGATLAKRVPAAHLRGAFAWFVLGMALLMVWKQLPSSVTGALAGAPLALALATTGALFAALVYLRSRRATVAVSPSPSPPKART